MRRSHHRLASSLASSLKLLLPGGSPSYSTVSVDLVERYTALLREGTLRADPAQERCVVRLQQLADELAAYGEAVKAWHQACAQYDAEWQRAAEQLTAEEERRAAADGRPDGQRAASPLPGSFMAWMRATLGDSGSATARHQADGSAAAEARSRAEQRLAVLLGAPPPPPAQPRGVYLYGSVGSGKTMLADMLYTAAAEAELVPLRRRLHCNAALLELHQRMHGIERTRSAKQQRRLERPSAELAAQEEHAAFSPLQMARQLLDVRDPLTAKQKQSRKARIAQRRLTRYRLTTSPDEFSKALAASNSAIMLQAARALLRSGGAAAAPPAAAAAGPAGAAVAKHAAALLVFDEMQTADPYNVAALKALTEAALADGGVLVATSNRSPAELSRHGLHEDMFGHFVESLHTGCDVVELSSERDYRRVALNAALRERHGGGLAAAAGGYFHPQAPEAEAALAAAWAELPGGSNDSAAPMRLPVMFGRHLEVMRHRGGAAWFDFEELCARPLGPADYVAVAGAFHTVLLSGVPQMSMCVRDQARRFITLVDELYNHRARLVCSAAVPPDQLFAGSGSAAEAEEPILDLEGLQFEGETEGARLRRDLGGDGGVAPVAATPARVAALGGAEESFAFARAVSRLHEMQSEGYRRASAVKSPSDLAVAACTGSACLYEIQSVSAGAPDGVRR